MLITKREGSKDRYGVYYLVYGSLAGDELVKAYFWAGPYTELKAAVEKAEELKLSHQNDNCFMVQKYKEK